MKFYKRDPDRALAGMAELTLEQRGAYNTLLDLLYSRDGMVPDDDFRVAKMMSCHTREWVRIKAQLIKIGKVWVEDGNLCAKRVLATIADAKKFSEEQTARIEKRWHGDKIDRPEKPLTSISEASISDVNGKNSNTQKEVKSENAKQINAAPIRGGNTSIATATAIARAEEKPRDAFDDFETKVRNLVGISGTPLAIAPDISPLWRLVQGGMPLDAVIVPTLNAIAKRPRSKPIQSWHLMAKIVAEEAGQTIAANIPATAKTEHAGEWEERLAWARKNQKWWDGWGNQPGTIGCLVPAALVKPGDGNGWRKHEA